MRRNLLARSLPFALAVAALGCGSQAQTGTVDELPLSSELAITTGDDATLDGATSQALEPQGPPSLFRMAREGLAHFNADVRALLERIHTIAANHEPTIKKDGLRVWVREDGDSMMRLVIERKLLGEIGYSPEDQLPGEGAVDDGQGRLDAKLVAYRFRFEMKRRGEDDARYRLAAQGHVVRVPGEKLGSGALVVHRARIAEVDQRLVVGREAIAARFDHRGRSRRAAVAHRAGNNQGDAVRAVWIYRQLEDRAGALQFVRWGDLPNTPVAGGADELVTVFEQWLRTDAGLVARAHARVSRGDLGPDALDIIECMDRIDHIGFRLVSLPDGQKQVMGDPRACHPFDRDVPPPPHDNERMPK